MRSIVFRDFRGFTLIEVMMAVTIFGLVIIPLFSGFQSFLSSSQKIRNEIQSIKNFQDVVHRMCLDLGQVYILPSEQYARPDSFSGKKDPFRFHGTVESLDGREVSSLVFSSFAHAFLGNQSRPGVARIAYYLKANAQGGYDLFRSDMLYPFPMEERFCFDPVLVVQVSRFEAVFIDREGNQYQTWDSDSSENEFTFPEKIQFTLGLETEQGQEEYRFFVPLMSGRPQDE